MKAVLHFPGGRTRALRWTDEHAASSYGQGVLLYRHTDTILDGFHFCLLRDYKGAWIETDDEERVRGALGIPGFEPLKPTGEPPSEDASILLKLWRTVSGHQQADAAAVLGVPLKTYQGWEQGRPVPHPRMLGLALVALLN